MKNVAIISTSLNSGGAERIAGLLSKEISRKYNVYLFLLSTEDIVYEWGGTIVDIGQLGPFYEYLIKFYKSFYKIDVAISFLEIMNFANIRTLGDEKIIISERCVQSRVEPSLISQSIKIKRYYDFADEIVSCSEGVKFDLVHNYGIENRITTIYNFIEKEVISVKAHEHMPDEVGTFLKGAEFFVNVGRLHPQKNQKRLIMQFAHFHELYQNIKLLIIGSGELELELESYIAELGLRDSVKVVKYTSNPFLYVARAKALVIASHYEGLPNVILEAMTLGCPIIAADCLAGPRELLIDEMDYKKSMPSLKIGQRGILVCDNKTEDNGNSWNMAKAMDILCSSDSLAEELRENELAYMKEYTNRKILEQWINVIERGKQKKRVNVLEKEEELLCKAKHIVIYGAGHVGKNIFLRLSKQYKIDCFVVSKKKTWESEFLGIPIYAVTELDYCPDDTVAIIGVGDNSQDDVIRTLQKYGFMQYVFPYIEL